MKLYIQIFTLLILLVSCKNKQTNGFEENIKAFEKTSISNKIANLKNSHNKEIIVVAHRADWRNAPENSLLAIQNCIDMGVDMVEVDVQKTKDGKLIIMHDETINRTTTGIGMVKDWSLDSLKTLQLKDGLGVATEHKIPTLKEVLLLTKDKILVNLDKSYSIFDQCYEIIKETGTQDQVIIKGAESKALVENEFGQYLDKVIFMPVIDLTDSEAMKMVDEYMLFNPPIAIEFIFPSDTLKGVSNFYKLRGKGTSVWVNSLWPRLNGGHGDEKAVTDPSVYDWYIDNGVNIIQTDRPQLLLNYLRSKGLHI